MSNLEALLVVVKRLGSLRSRVVFVGGSVRGLLITDEAAPPERPTDDVDGIVSISTRGEYYRFADELRGLGFHEDVSEGAPMCRWLVAGVRVDTAATCPGTAGLVEGAHTRSSVAARADAASRKS